MFMNHLVFSFGVCELYMVMDCTKVLSVGDVVYGIPVLHEDKNRAPQLQNAMQTTTLSTVDLNTVY